MTLRKRLLGITLMVFMTGACSTVPKQAAPIASDLGSPLCLVDREILVELAPSADYNDVGNKYDSDKTYKAVEIHNERLRAACN
jgi:hypothetical protein